MIIMLNGRAVRHGAAGTPCVAAQEEKMTVSVTRNFKELLSLETVWASTERPRHCTRSQRTDHRNCVGESRACTVLSTWAELLVPRMAAREYSYLAVDINALFRAKDKCEAQERRSRLQSKRERVRGRFGIDADARAGNLHDPFWLRGSSPENSPRLCATSSSSSSRTVKDAASLSPTQRHERQHADRRPRTTPTRWGEH